LVTEINFFSHNTANGEQISTMTYKDKAYLYFMREASISSNKGLATLFGISRVEVQRICITWAKVCKIRYAAFGMYLNWAEYKAICPDDWSFKYNNRRCHLWDTTNISLREKPRAAFYQQI